MRMRVRRHDVARRKRKKNAEKNKKSLWIKISVSLFAVLIIAAGALVVTRAMGKKSLYDNDGENATASLRGDNSVKIQEEEWQEGDISYRGAHYRYNEEILTFLVMGIDSEEVVPGVGELDDYTMGSQADAQFLVVLNPRKKTISLIAVNRNAMTEVEVCDSDNRSKGIQKLQIAVQHGFGDGRELSCKRSVKAVSNLFYNLPIHGYCAINMGAIADINDSVGGVELEVLDPISDGNVQLWAPGEVTTLMGRDAFLYLKYRDVNIFDSASNRLERQKQYLGKFVGKAREATKANIGYPVALYNAVLPYLVTDVSVSEVNYLAGELLGYSFNEGQIYSLEGETVMGETYEEFYVDESALQDLIIQLFYDKVEKRD